MINIVVFASGNGSNFKEIYIRTLKKEIKGIIVLLISNNPKSGAVKFAKENNIKFEVINLCRFKNSLDKQYEIVLKKHKTDLILLAGFMKKIPKNIIQIYKNKIMNIHPSLLPKYGGKGFYGSNVHNAVIDSGDSYSGATVHYVNEEYDKGSVIKQEKVKIEPSDNSKTLAEKVLIIEHKIYSEAIKIFCEKRI